MGDKRVLISGNGLGKSIFVSQEEALKKAYEKGREDERKDWKCAAGEMVVKYAGDIYEALPEAVKEIYEQGRKDGIAEANLAHNIECGDCVRQITAADETRIRAEAIDEYTEWLRKSHANFDEDYAEDIKSDYLEWLKEQKND